VLCKTANAWTFSPNYRMILVLIQWQIFDKVMVPLNQNPSFEP
jgi:hypothetical protein